MTSEEARLVATRLDEDHRPETNGRMAVCRRCGAQTNDLEGHAHAPNEGCVSRSTAWLDAQNRLNRIGWAQESLRN